MSRIRRPEGALVLHALTAAALISLTACGGGGGDSGSGTPAPPAAVATAAEDSYALAWNAPASLDVTANDTVANGTATVAVDALPKHGTATVSGTKVSYTPTAGFFGDDSFTYKLVVGSASQTATVKLKVEATMTLQGMVTDDPISNAAVQVNVGGKVFSGTADASGNYSVTIKTSQPTDFISLIGAGVGTQSSVVLTSLVGEAGSLSTSAVNGTVSADREPSLNVTHISSVRAALATQVAASAPSTDASLATALQSVSSGATLDRAATLKMIIDGRVPLPPGMADTQALLSSPATLTALLHKLQSVNTDELDAVRQTVIADARLSSAPPVPSAGSAPLTLLYGTGYENGSTVAVVLTLRADGSGSEVSDRVRSFKWKLDGHTVLITYDQVISEIYDGGGAAFLGDKLIDVNVTSRLDIQGRRLADMAANGRGDMVAAVTTFGTLTPLLRSSDPVPAGPARNVSGGEVLKRHVSAGTFKAEDFAAGTKLAGLSATIAVDAGGLVESHQDIATFNAGGTLTLSRTGQTGTWKIVDGRLRVDLPDTSHLYTLLGKLPSGEARWLLQVLDAQGAPTLAVEVSTIAVAPPTLDAAFWTHTFRSNIGASWLEGTMFDLREDARASTGTYTVDNNGVRQTTYNSFWRQLSDGLIEISRPSTANCVLYVAGGAPGPVPCVLRQQRLWQPVARAGNTVWVMQQGVMNISQGGGSGSTRWSLVSLTPQSN